VKSSPIDRRPVTSATMWAHKRGALHYQKIGAIIPKETLWFYDYEVITSSDNN